MSTATVPLGSSELPKLDYRSKINPLPQFYLFSPADVRFETDVNAETLVFPKTDELACFVYSTPVDRCVEGMHAKRCPWRGSPVSPIPGVLPIREQAGYPDPKSGKMLRAMSAQEVVTTLIGPDGTLGKVGKKGVRILLGDERDVIVRQDASIAYREAKYYTSLARKNSHMHINEKQRDAGLPVLPPSKEVMAAMDYVARYEREFNPTAKYSCPECGLPCVEKGDRDAHIVTHHRDRASLYGLQDAAGFEALRPDENEEAETRAKARAADKAAFDAQERAALSPQQEGAFASSAPSVMSDQVQELRTAMQEQMAEQAAEIARLKSGRRKGVAHRKRVKAAPAPQE